MNLNSVLKMILTGLVRIYQSTLGLFLGGACRFYPSCSNYAVEALENKAPLEAIILILKRLLKCHPWGGSGYDPVPSLAANEEYK